MVLTQFSLFIVATLAAAIPGIVGWAMLPDCVEYGEYKIGIRGEGIITSSMTFINKFGIAIGGLLGGVLLGATNYIPQAEIQSEAVLSGIKLGRLFFPIAGYICSIIAMRFYSITNEKFAEITEALAKRNA